jgi:hypothetical protein
MAFSPDVAMGGDKVTVSGTVTDTFGSPIEGATVELKVQGAAPLDLTTDASGHFSRTGPVSSGLGSYSMTATASKNYYKEASASASMTILPPLIYLLLLLIIILGIMGAAITLRRRSRSRSAGNEASSPDQA